jgi:hypothetical protein
MTMNPRDHREWSNKEVEENPQGYLAAQEAYREHKATEEQKKRDADDLERYTEAFVAAGGNKSDAAAAFRAHRNEQAATAARRADQEAAEQARRRIRSVV